MQDDPFGQVIDDPEFLEAFFQEDTLEPLEPLLPKNVKGNGTDSHEIHDLELEPDSSDFSHWDIFTVNNTRLSLKSNALWMAEPFFGRAARLDAATVHNAIAAFPDHSNAIKHWWKGYQSIRDFVRTDSDEASTSDLQAVVDDASKFALLRASAVPTMTLVHEGRLITFEREYQEEAVPGNLKGRYRRRGKLRPDAEISFDRSDPRINQNWSEGHRGDIYIASILAMDGKIAAIGPIISTKKLRPIDGPLRRMTKIHLLEGKRPHPILSCALKGDGMEPSIHSSEIEVCGSSEVYARFEEAIQLFAEGSRSIFRIGVVVSETSVSFVAATDVTLRDQDVHLTDVSLDHFDRQLKDISTEATIRFERKLLAKCLHFLGEYPAAALDDEGQAILDTLFKILKAEVSSDNMQSIWDRLENGVNTWAALNAVQEHYGIELLEVPWSDPD